MLKRYLSEPLFLFFAFLGSCSIIGSSYVGLNGDLIWRQSDVYAHILGFLGHKGMTPMHDFLGDPTLYDIPFYQFIIATLAQFTSSEALVVTRYVDFACWLVLMLAGGVMAETYGAGNRVYVWLLLLVSPLFLHYFATPLPDVMALALSAAAMALIMGDWGDRRPSVIWPALLLMIAALIKSPVPFIFLVYYFVKTVMERGQDGEAVFSSRRRVIYAVSLIGALGAEMLRRFYLGTNVGGFAQDPSWYFGTLEQRLSQKVWSVAWFRISEAQPHAPLAFVMLGLMALYAVLRRREALRVLAPFATAFFAGWLTFTNVYVMHAYYELPVTFMFFMATAVTIGALIRLADARVQTRGKSDFSWHTASLAAMIAAAPVLMIFGNKMSAYANASIMASARYALLNVDHFLWVDEKPEGPAVGGVVATPLTWIKPDAFEQNCARLVAENRAILVKGHSPCLARYRGIASTYINDADIQIFVKQTAEPTPSAPNP